MSEKNREANKILKGRRRDFGMGPAGAAGGLVMRATWTSNDGTKAIIESRAMTIDEFHAAWRDEAEALLAECSERMNAEDAAGRMR